MSNKQRKRRRRWSDRNREINAVRSGSPNGADVQIHRRDLTCRTYQVRQDTFNETERTIEAVIATEARVMVFDMNRWELIEEILLMEGARFGDQVSFIDTHDRSTIEKQLGSTRSMRVEGDKLVGTNHFATTTEGQRAFTLTKEKHLRDNSIGYRVINYATLEPGKTATVAGKTFTASATRSLRITTEWEVRENSACPIGADVNAKNRQDPEPATSQAGGGSKSINNPEHKETRTMKEFKEWLEKRGLKLDELSETHRAVLKTDFDAEQKRAEIKPAASAASAQPAQRTETDTTEQPATVDEDALRAEGATAELERQTQIRAAADGIDAEVVQRCIDEGKTLDQARAAFLEELRGDRSTEVHAPGIIVHSSDVNRDMLVDALCVRAGFVDMVLSESEGEKRAEQAERIRDISLLDICRHALMLDNVAVPVGREELIRASFSTASLPTILGAVYNKSLLRGYASVEQTWMKWCNEGSAPDFKTITRVRLTDTGDFEKLGAGGEMATGSKTEEKEQYNLDTYAKRDRITRQQLINDDLGVLTRTPQRMGARGVQRIGELVYTHLLANGAMVDDSVALFHADHNNLITSSALTETKLKAALTKFRKQTNKEGKPIKVKPTYLIVPPELEFTALKLIKSAQIFITGTTDATVGDINVLKGLLEVIVEEALSNTTYSGYSLTSWYISADPKLADTVEVGFLNGRKVPTVQTFGNIPGVLGIEFDAYIDVAVKALDFRGLQKNTA